MAENIDLSKTFTTLGGAKFSCDGHSLTPLLTARAPADWQNAVLVEHHGGQLSVLDPDYQRSPSGTPTIYDAMRTHDYLYVEYADGEREFYDLRNDPYELHNIAGNLTPPALALLHRQLFRLERCLGGKQCWAATHVEPGVPATVPKGADT